MLTVSNFIFILKLFLIIGTFFTCSIFFTGKGGGGYGKEGGEGVKRRGEEGRG